MSITDWMGLGWLLISVLAVVVFLAARRLPTTPADPAHARVLIAVVALGVACSAAALGVVLLATG